ncbi:hypothetical protein ACFE04_022781 [Oxalis oulophora]
MKLVESLPIWKISPIDESNRMRKRVLMAVHNSLVMIPRETNAKRPEETTEVRANCLIAWMDEIMKIPPVGRGLAEDDKNRMKGQVETERGGNKVGSFGVRLREGEAETRRHHHAYNRQHLTLHHQNSFNHFSSTHKLGNTNEVKERHPQRSLPG